MMIVIWWWSVLGHFWLFLLSKISPKALPLPANGAGFSLTPTICMKEDLKEISEGWLVVLFQLAFCFLTMRTPFIFWLCLRSIKSSRGILFNFFVSFKINFPGGTSFKVIRTTTNTTSTLSSRESTTSTTS